MNYVKITAKSQQINLRLFVKESDCGKALKGLQSIHMNQPAFYVTDVFGCKENRNKLCVTMRRVRIEKKRIATRLQPIIEASFAKLAV